MKINNKIIIMLIITLTILTSFFLYGKKDNPKVDNSSLNKVVIKNELKDVNFCGKNYKMKQVILDGVDVGQKIAKIVTNDLIPSNIISYGVPLKVCSTDIFGKNEEYIETSFIKYNNVYVIKFITKINTLSFSIIGDEIFYDDMYGGTEVGPIGNIK